MGKKKSRVQKRPPVVLEEEPPIPDSEQTPITCQACRGDFRTTARVDGSAYSDVVCRFCTRGAMNESQFKKWSEYCRKQLDVG